MVYISVDLSETVLYVYQNIKYIIRIDLIFIKYQWN
jgi:hypothetical protein